MKTTGEILKEYRIQNNITASEVAEKIGVSQQFLTAVENGKRKLSSKVFEALKEIMPKSYIEDIQKYEDYIKTPEGVKNELEKLKEEVETLKGNAKILDTKIIELPVYGKASAGPGYINLSDIKYMKRVIDNGFSKNSYLVEVEGDSMEPRIVEGSFALVDPQDIDYMPGKVYVVTYNDETFIKKIEVHQEGRLVILKSFNPNYEDKILIGSNIKDLKIEGRVVKVINEDRF